MRLIDADALKEDLTRFYDNEVTARELIDEQPTIGGWISVKDRLPDRQTPALVYVPPYSDEGEKYSEYVGVAYHTYTAIGGYWAGTDGNVYGAIGIIHDPTHWMPLPEPPKEAEQDGNK